jgi:hypothetical protein
MKETEDLLKSIEEKARKIQSERLFLTQEIKRLEQRITELNTIINQQKEHISKLENLQFIQNFTGLLQDENSVRTKERLTELLQEIDKCIEIVS